MAGYYGTNVQRLLQAQAESSIGFINATPGACQAGRTMGCDSVKDLGWEQIDEILNRDGICGFRLISASEATELALELAKRSFRLDTWDVFLAERTAALAACEAILSAGLPENLRNLKPPHQAEDEYTAAIQELMSSCGVVPFSGSLLVGALAPGTTVAVGDGGQTVVAAAHGYLPHNSYSPFHRYAWGGLVAVADSHRGRGLGSYINARMITTVFRDLHASHIYELVSASNIPSRRMVASCGLRHQPDLVCGIATPTKSAHFTR